MGEKRNKEQMEHRKKNNRTVDLNPVMSIITLYINGINTSIKR